MATLTYSPGCRAALSIGGAAPQVVPKVLHADTMLSIAPSVGTANLVVADPDGRLAALVKPNDRLNVVFSSRLSKWKNLGQLAPGPASAWSGLVNSAVPAYDPRAAYGRALKINAWTMWKPLVVTSVPLSYFFSAQYPRPGIPLTTLLTQAIQACQQEMHLTIPLDFSEASIPLQTANNVAPNDMSVNDPQAQNWAVFLMSLLTAAGVESYAREDGTIIVRDFQGMQNPDLRSLLTIPTREMFS